MRKGLRLDDLGDLLEQPLLAILATHRSDGSLVLSPVWHEWSDGVFLVCLADGDRKEAHIARDPKVTLVIAEHGLPYRGLEVRGTAIASTEQYGPTMQRLATRYLGAIPADLYPASMPGTVIRITPTQLRAWDFADDLAALSNSPMTTPVAAARRERFRNLHRDGLFVMPNAWDIGSARLLASLGFEAIATTSSGHAASLGKADQTVSRDELLAHIETLAGAVNVPLSVDAERCFADDPPGVAETVRRIAAAGAAGCSIEDYDPARNSVDPIEVAAERVAAAAEEGHRNGLVITARAENHLYGIGDLDDTIQRHVAYREAGADVLYAPGLVDREAIQRVVESVAKPVNVLATRNGPPISELAALGVRRVSTGGALARAAYGALIAAAHELRSAGTSTYLDRAVRETELATALSR